MKELRRSSTVMESTFHSMAEAVLVIDATGNVLLANPAAERMLRYWHRHERPTKLRGNRAPCSRPTAPRL